MCWLRISGDACPASTYSCEAEAFLHDDNRRSVVGNPEWFKRALELFGVECVSGD